MSNNSRLEHPEYFKPAAEDEVVSTGGFAATQDAPSWEKMVSNRTTAAVTALGGGVLFALLYALATFAYSAAAWAYGSDAGRGEAAVFIQDRTLGFIATPVYWLTVLGFTLYFVLLALAANKGPWRKFVLWGLLVAIATYATAIGAGLLTVNAWTLTFTEALQFMWHSIAFNPLVLVAVVLSREIPIWLGGFIAVKAKKHHSDDISV